MDEILVDVKDMSCNFHFFNLNNISFQLREGYITCIIGENASGKSALLEILSGQHNNYKGQMIISGKIGTIVRDKLNSGGYSPNKIIKKFEKNADYFSSDKMSELLRKYEINETDKFSNMSEVSKWLFWISLYMSSDIKLLLLDEPFAFLNKEEIKIITSVLQEFVEEGEKSIIVATNNFGEIESIVDFFGIMSGGKMILFAERDELLSSFCCIYGESEIIDSIPQDMILYRKKNSVSDEAIVIKETMTKEKFFLDTTYNSFKIRELTLKELFFSIIKSRVYS
ncbi:MAG: ATP-binding cassette domain-containing protein [Lachnospira sp.]